MIRKTLLLVLFIGHLAFSQEYKMENDELKGNIKSLHLSVLEDDNAAIPIEIKNYDSKGRLLVSKTYYDGRINTTERSQYTGNQVITELCDYCEDLDKALAGFSIKENEKYPYKGYVTADPKRTLKIIKTMDKKGNPILSKTYSSEGYLLWTTQSTFDKNSKLLLQENYDDEGKKKPAYKKISYTDKGLIAEEIVFENNFERKNTFKYDNLGRKIAEKEWQGSSIIERSYEYVIEKDTSKVLVYWKNDKNETVLLRTEISYLEKDRRIIKETGLYNGKPSYTKILEYDKNDNLVLKQSYNDQNELRSEIKVIYDKKDNWIEIASSNLIKASYNGSEPKPEWRIKKYIRKIEYN